MKIALVYDHVNKIGGAERILEALHELYPDAPLFTAVYDKYKAYWAKKFQVIPSFLQRLPFAKARHEYYPGLPVLAFEKFNFNDFDIVISITSAEAKGIITSPNTFHLCYCLTPTRYLWSHYDDYFQNRIVRIISSPVISWLRMWDVTASQRPDVIVAISKTVKRRIKKYYRRDAEVVYPPVTIQLPITNCRLPIADNFRNYFLVVSRLVKYKRIEVAIKACNQLKLPLIVIGSGFEKGNLVKLAGKTVKFIDNLTDDELIDYYQNCRALIFPQEEDFGITAVEAQACGKPVIAYKAGGATETVVDDETGIFYKEQTVEALTDALKRFEIKDFNVEKCRKNAEKFGKERFKKEFSNLLKSEYINYKNRFINIKFL